MFAKYNSSKIHIFYLVRSYLFGKKVIFMPYMSYRGHFPLGHFLYIKVFLFFALTNSNLYVKNISASCPMGGNLYRFVVFCRYAFKVFWWNPRSCTRCRVNPWISSSPIRGPFNSLLANL